MIVLYYILKFLNYINLDYLNLYRVHNIFGFVNKFIILENLKKYVYIVYSINFFKINF